MYDPDADRRIGGPDNKIVKDSKSKIIQAFKDFMNGDLKEQKLEKIIQANKKIINSERSEGIQEWQKKCAGFDAERIRNMIEEEIDGNWNMTNAHGVDLRKCLVDPVERVYLSSSQHKVKLWLVLEEDPIERKGYKIVFNPRNGKFGLATTVMKSNDNFDTNFDLYLGQYGSFIETLEAM